MSHAATIKTQFLHEEHIRRAAEICGAKYDPEVIRRQVSNKSAVGRAVTLNGWYLPIVIAENGEVTYDDYNGHWGDMKKFEQFKQAYEVSVSMATLGLDNMTVTQRTLPNGDVELIAEDANPAYGQAQAAPAWA